MTWDAFWSICRWFCHLVAIWFYCQFCIGNFSVCCFFLGGGKGEKGVWGPSVAPEANEFQVAWDAFLAICRLFFTGWQVRFTANYATETCLFFFLFFRWGVRGGPPLNPPLSKVVQKHLLLQIIKFGRTSDSLEASSYVIITLFKVYIHFILWNQSLLQRIE